MLSLRTHIFDKQKMNTSKNCRHRLLLLLMMVGCGDNNHTLFIFRIRTLIIVKLIELQRRKKQLWTLYFAFAREYFFSLRII